MINLNTLSDNIYDEFSKFIDEQDLQILAERTLGNMSQRELTLPRLIFGFTSYSSSDYHYMRTENDIDKVRQIVDFNSNLSMVFRIYSDEENANNIFDVINKLHNFYRNPYIKKLEGKMVVDNLSSINSVSVDDDDLVTTGYMFTLSFNMSEELVTEADYAETFVIKKVAEKPMVKIIINK